MKLEIASKFKFAKNFSYKISNFVFKTRPIFHFSSQFTSSKMNFLRYQSLNLHKFWVKSNFNFKIFLKNWIWPKFQFKNFKFFHPKHSHFFTFLQISHLQQPNFSSNFGSKFAQFWVKILTTSYFSSKSSKNLAHTTSQHCKMLKNWLWDVFT